MFLGFRDIFYKYSIILDIFPVQLKLNIDGDEKKSTLIGLICSLFLIIFSLVLMISNSLYSFSYIKPIILNSNELNEKREPINISSERFSNLFFFYNSNFEPYNFKIEDNAVYNRMIKIENNKVIAKDKFQRNQNNCSNLFKSNSFYEKMKSKFKRFYYRSICTDFSNTNISFGGDFFQGQDQSILMSYMKLNLCNEENSKELCDTNKLKGKRFSFSLIYQNHYFDPEIEIGYKNFTDYLEIESAFDKDVIITITLTKNILYSDDNIYFSEPKKKNYTFFTIKEINVEKFEREQLQIITIFKLEQLETIFKRSYVKLDSVLASTYTIISILYFIIAASLNFIESENINYYLMKRLYYFEKQLPIYDLNKEELKDNSNKSVHNFVKVNNNQSPVIDHNNSNRIQKSKSKEIENLPTFSNFKLEDLSKNSISVKFDLIKYFFYKICVCKRDNKYFDSLQLFLIANSVLKYDLNIVNILKKLIEFETIKDLFFSNNQSKLMKIIYNRKIKDSIDPESEIKKLNEKLYEINVNSNELINEFISPFDNCLYSKDKLDMKIIKRINN